MTIVLQKLLDINETSSENIPRVNCGFDLARVMSRVMGTIFVALVSEAAIQNLDVEVGSNYAF